MSKRGEPITLSFGNLGYDLHTVDIIQARICLRRRTLLRVDADEMTISEDGRSLSFALDEQQTLGLPAGRLDIVLFVKPESGRLESFAMPWSLDETVLTEALV